MQEELDNNKTTEDLLCNRDGLLVNLKIIGDVVMEEEPFVTLESTRVTSVTAAEINSHVAAFLGTDDGRILKVWHN